MASLTAILSPQQTTEAPQAAILIPQAAIVVPQAVLSISQAAIETAQATTLAPQAAIEAPQAAIFTFQENYKAKQQPNIFRHKTTYKKKISQILSVAQGDASQSNKNV
ncbi:hypothetical protein [Flavobacterium sp. GCM10027622]|uniref:hypothetical protein n=1 Tax=unclassified Flavobacterium TaxID=196869 RepID=UPI003608466C